MAGTVEWDLSAAVSTTHHITTQDTFSLQQTEHSSHIRPKLSLKLGQLVDLKPLTRQCMKMSPLTWKCAYDWERVHAEFLAPAGKSCGYLSVWVVCKSRHGFCLGADGSGCCGVWVVCGIVWAHVYGSGICSGILGKLALHMYLYSSI